MNETVRPIKLQEPLSIPVEGMTCASCVRRVETAAAKVPGVASSSVNFATKKLTVAPIEGFSAKSLAAAVKKIGYEIEPTRAEFFVDGVKDDVDASRLKGVLEAIATVVSVQVDAKGRVVVEGMGGLRQREMLIEAARAAGFPLAAAKDAQRDHATHHHGSEDDHAHHMGDEATLKRDAIIAAMLTAPLFVLEMGGHVYAPMHHWLMGIVDTQNLY